LRRLFATSAGRAEGAGAPGGAPAGPGGAGVPRVAARRGCAERRLRRRLRGRGGGRVRRRGRGRARHLPGAGEDGGAAAAAARAARAGAPGARDQAAARPVREPHAEEPRLISDFRLSVQSFVECLMNFG